MTTLDPAALAALRRDYRFGVLDETTIAPDWLTQLRAWFDRAVEDLGALEANALQVATVDASGRPSLRTVLAKGIDERGVSFFTNYSSAKGRDLDARGYAAIQFVWQAHERQVRLTGTVSRVSREETEAYFATRPRGSQLGAWASPQSQRVASRVELEQALADVVARFGEGPVPAPPNWGGYRLSPDSVEFWQGRADRLHDRLRFRLADDAAWVLERLAP
jgi:pyridoxamine 5'-phosphate oxidase